MAGLPQKSIKGANLKKWLIEAVDGIIDYLKSGIYLVPGPGISIERKPSGIVISAKKPSVSAPPPVKPAASSVQDISATVSGGTATITLSGSTSSVLVAAGSNVNITVGTNGEVIIGATGGTASSVGFPDYFNKWEIGLELSTPYSFAYPVCLIGSVGSVWYDTGGGSTSGDVRGGLRVWITDDGTNYEAVYAFYANFEAVNDDTRVESFVNVPIPAGYTFTLQAVGDDPDISELSVYPCI